MNTHTMIIDVREPDEYNSGHVEGALNIPPAELLAGSKQLNEVPKDKKIVVYCRTGSRSNAAIHVLQQMGFRNLTNGINAAHVAKHLTL